MTSFLFFFSSQSCAHEINEFSQLRGITYLLSYSSLLKHCFSHRERWCVSRMSIKNVSALSS